MKKVLGLLICVILATFCIFALADVAINEKNFPDPSFRQFVHRYDKDDSGILSDDELNEVTSMNVSEQGIETLEGIRFFSSLTSLVCHMNSIRSLDVSMNTNLTYLACWDNPIIMLNVIGNTKLKEINCCDNQLTSLDVSTCTALESLRCQDNQLIMLNVGDINLLTLSCGHNRLKTLDVSNNIALKDLGCSNNQLTSLDVRNNTELEGLGCENNQLSLLDVSNNTALKGLWCSNNLLTSIDVSKNTELTSLNCRNNLLTSIDVSKNNELTSLDCGNNLLDLLDISKNLQLTEVCCENNKLNSLDLNNNVKLTKLQCNNNQLYALDISKNKQLDTLSCYSNKISTLDVGQSIKLSDNVQKESRVKEKEYNYWKSDESRSCQLLVDSNSIVKAKRVISYPGFTEAELFPVKIKKAIINDIPNQTYTGKAIKPMINMKVQDYELVEGVDYTVSYKDNRAVGMATITVIGKGNFAGRQNSRFVINPAAIKLSSLKAGKQSLTVKWKKGSGIDGYEIEYSLKESFKNAEKVTVSKAETTITVLEGLKEKKTYYVRIRGFKKIKGKDYYSEWSKTLNKKTK